MSYKQLLFIGSLAFCIILAASYTTTGTEKERKEDFGNDTSSIIPVNLPVNIVPGFSFPADSNQVYQWINGHYDSAKIYQHAWGIWAGLTAQSGEVLAGDSLLVYQTWDGPEDITNAINNNTYSGKTGVKKTNRTLLQIPKQFIHAGLVKTTKSTLPEGKNLHNLSLNKLVSTRNRFLLSNTSDSFQLLEGVAYNPQSANYLVSRSLFKLSVLNSFRKTNAIGTIPPFPRDAINLKPTYFIGHISDRYIKLPVWQGVPARKIFPDSVTQYNSYVFVDAMNRQQSGKMLVPVTGNESRTAAATCNLANFIYFAIDSRMDSVLAAQGLNANLGDVALLVGMHVTTKEVSNWTWQSFYWAPNPGEPFAPSSQMADSLKPSVYLTGAASHYAVGAAYAMVLPNQPIDDGTNTGVNSLFGYNPYLEAGFAGLQPSKLNPSFTYGVQTNCMSCHAQATLSGNLLYNTDEYISMNDPKFKNDVQLDFAWSIQGNIDNTKITKNKAK